MAFSEDDVEKLEVDKLLESVGDVNFGESGFSSADESAEVEISDDKMLATIKFTKPLVDGRNLELEEIKTIIASYNIKYGLLDDIIELLALPTKTYDYPIEIAIGKKEILSQDAYIEYTYDNGGMKELKEKEDGSVDLFELNLIQNVREGETLAILHPMVQGENGIDIFGNTISVKDGKPALLSGGKGTVVSENGLELIAEINGQLINENGKLTVQNIYEISGDVDTTTGNIEFLGSVIINGSIRAGFKVIADGNVEVKGVVEAAYIETSGDVIITGGMQGSKVGKIKAGGRVVSKFFENAIVEAKGDVMADAIMHCDISSSGQVIVAGKKGLIVGGKVSATKGIKAKTIGSHMATQTDIVVGASADILDKYQEIKVLYDRNSKELVQSEQIVNILETKKAELGGLPQDKLDMLAKAIKTKEYLSALVPNIREKMGMLMNIIEQVDKYYVEAEDTIFPGTRIDIANEKKIVSEEIIHSKVVKKNGEIVVEIL